MKDEHKGDWPEGKPGLNPSSDTRIAHLPTLYLPWLRLTRFLVTHYAVPSKVAVW